MGMDVHGLNPVIRRETSNTEVRDLLEQDWTKLSEDDLGKYFEAKQQYEEDNPGVYFRNNVWRPGLLLKCSMSEIEQLFTIIFFIYVIASETEDQEISDEVIIVE